VHDLDVTFDGKVSRRDFLKFLAAGATTLAFGSILGFSSLFSTTTTVKVNRILNQSSALVGYIYHKLTETVMTSSYNAI
jgi:TAT (twin-arginine translocation) pathway signal sequence